MSAKVVSHRRYVTFQMAEVAVPRQMFAEILSLIARLGHGPRRYEGPVKRKFARRGQQRCVSMQASQRVSTPRHRKPPGSMASCSQERDLSLPKPLKSAILRLKIAGNLANVG